MLSFVLLLHTYFL